MHRKLIHPWKLLCSNFDINFHLPLRTFRRMIFCDSDFFKVKNLNHTPFHANVLIVFTARRNPFPSNSCMEVLGIVTQYNPLDDRSSQIPYQISLQPHLHEYVSRQSISFDLIQLLIFCSHTDRSNSRYRSVIYCARVYRSRFPNKEDGTAVK